jgi:hypothetical protein
MWKPTLAAALIAAFGATVPARAVPLQIRIDAAHSRVLPRAIDRVDVMTEGNDFVVVTPLRHGRADSRRPLGLAYVSPGTSRDIRIQAMKPLDPDAAYALVLHHDSNKDRKYEPGIDKVVTYSGTPVMAVVRNRG